MVLPCLNGRCVPAPVAAAGVQNRMGSTFFALAFLAFTSLTTGACLLVSPPTCRQLSALPLPALPSIASACPACMP